jgi:hypothetical protein
MWTLIGLSVIAALLGIGVTVFYALRIAGVWSVKLDHSTEEFDAVAGVIDPSKTGVVGKDEYSNNYKIPYIDASVNVVDFLSDAPERFELVSYVNDLKATLDDTYIGTYVRGDITTVTDYSEASLYEIGTRVAVWVNSENPERIIGLYYFASNSTYQFEISAYQNSATYGERLIRTSRHKNIGDSSNIMNVSVSSSWTRITTTGNETTSTIVFSAV